MARVPYSDEVYSAAKINYMVMDNVRELAVGEAKQVLRVNTEVPEWSYVDRRAKCAYCGQWGEPWSECKK